MSDPATFDEVVREEIAAFPENALVRVVVSGTVRMKHYHAILTTLIHQTRSGPYTFAAAAARCPWRFSAAKEYLLTHAEAERTHWRWVLDDLRATGYTGPDPLLLPPHPTTDAYIAINFMAVEQMALARLAIACVLEGIGATHGGTHGARLLQALGLLPHQASFFLSHGETDKTHTAELRKIVASCEMEPSEWEVMTRFARLAGKHYRAMYDHEAFA